MKLGQKPVPEQPPADLARGESSRRVELLEMQRANNVGIVLSRFQGLTPKDLRKMVRLGPLRREAADATRLTRRAQICTLDIPKAFSVDDVRAILSFLPTSDEADKLRAYAGDVERLGVAERHFLALMDIPRFRQRVACLMFKLKFGEVMSDVENDAEALRAGCAALIESPHLPLLLGMVRGWVAWSASRLTPPLPQVLRIGNELNSQGGALKPEDGYRQAAGFKLSALSKLRLAKSYQSNKTALHYFVSIVQERQVRSLSARRGDSEITPPPPRGQLLRGPC
jgi:hypothetical protein